MSLARPREATAVGCGHSPLPESAILPSRCVTIVGVLNLTPDSFSDGGRFVDTQETLEVEAAVEAGLALVAAGATGVSHLRAFTVDTSSGVKSVSTPPMS